MNSEDEVKTSSDPSIGASDERDRQGVIIPGVWFIVICGVWLIFLGNPFAQGIAARTARFSVTGNLFFLATLFSVYLAFCRDAFLKKSLWFGFGTSLFFMVPVTSCYFQSISEVGFWWKIPHLEWWSFLAALVASSFLFAWWLDPPADSIDSAIIGGLVAGYVPYVVFENFFIVASTFHSTPAVLLTLEHPNLVDGLIGMGDGMAEFLLLSNFVFLSPFFFVFLALLRVEKSVFGETSWLNKLLLSDSFQSFSLFIFTLNSFVAIVILSAISPMAAGVQAFFHSTGRVPILPTAVLGHLAVFPNVVVNTLLTIYWRKIFQIPTKLENKFLLVPIVTGMLSLAAVTWIVLEVPQKGFALFHSLLALIILLSFFFSANPKTVIPPTENSSCDRESMPRKGQSGQIISALQINFWSLPLVVLVLIALPVIFALTIGLEFITITGCLSKGMKIPPELIDCKGVLNFWFFLIAFIHVGVAVLSFLTSGIQFLTGRKKATFFPSNI